MCRNCGSDASWPGRCHGIASNVGFSMCSPFSTRLGLKATQGRPYDNVHGARRLTSSAPSPLSSQGPLFMMVEDGHNGQEILPDHRQWWAFRNHNFSLLTSQAQWLLTIPASQTQSGRLFSSASLIVTKPCHSSSADNVELLISLRNSWAAVDTMKKFKGIAQPIVRIFRALLS